MRPPTSGAIVIDSIVMRRRSAWKPINRYDTMLPPYTTEEWLDGALPRYAKKTLPRTPPKTGETQLNDLGCAIYCTRVVWDTFLASCAKPRFRHDRARDLGIPSALL
jgi:hypothetical protein